MSALASIIIPTYHGEKNLSRAIDTSLNQTWKNIEVIVVDDNAPGSESRALTEKIMQQYIGNDKVQYIKHEKNKNGAAARNTGWRASKGEYIAFLDDDDLYMPNRVEKCISVLENSEGFDLVFSSVLHVKYGLCRKIVSPKESPDMRRAMFMNIHLTGSGSNIFMRKSAVDELNGFDEDFVRHQDLEFLIRYFRKGKVKCIPDLLCIKFNDGYNNQPEYYKFKDIKMLYFERLQEDINQLSEEDKRNFYIFHYEQLLKSAIESTNNDALRLAVKDLKRYRNISHFEYALICVKHAIMGNPKGLSLSKRAREIIIRPAVLFRNYTIRRKYGDQLNRLISYTGYVPS
ncbi:MAG: glycosyltransferase [Clostridiaceae bacterium]|nr:glycosyltransferase [Clostridiaceae bacterium]